MKTNESIRKQVDQTFTRLETADCQLNGSHSGKFKVAFVCMSAKCDKRFICATCMVADESHKTAHRGQIKRIEQAKADLIDRLTDQFASDIELITQDASQKYTSKLSNCSKIVRTVCEESLKDRIAVGVSEVEDHFQDVILKPVMDLAGESQRRLDHYLTSILTDNENSPAEQIENFFEFLAHKGHEEKHIWDTAGKIIQRLKHNILYNKEIEHNLTSDVEDLTRRFISDIVRTYQSYFFVDKRSISDQLAVQKLSPQKSVKSAAKSSKIMATVDGKITSSPKKKVLVASTEKKQGKEELKKKMRKEGKEEGSERRGQGSQRTEKATIVVNDCGDGLDDAVLQSSDGKDNSRKDSFGEREVLGGISASSVKNRLVVSDCKLTISHFLLEENKENGDLGNSLKLSQFSEIADLSPKKQALSTINERKHSFEDNQIGLEAIAGPESSPVMNLTSACCTDSPYIRASTSSSKSQCTKRLTFTESTLQPNRSVFDKTEKSLLLKHFGESHLDIDEYCYQGKTGSILAEQGISTTDLDRACNFMQEHYQPALNSCFAYLQSTSLAYPFVSVLQTVTTLNKVEAVQRSFSEEELEQIVCRILVNHGCVGLSTWLTAEDYEYDHYAAFTLAAYHDCLITVAFLTLKNVEKTTEVRANNWQPLVRGMDSFMIEYLKHIELLIATSSGYLLDKLSLINHAPSPTETADHLYGLLSAREGFTSLSSLVSLLSETSTIVDELEAQFCFCLTLQTSKSRRLSTSSLEGTCLENSADLQHFMHKLVMLDSCSFDNDRLNYDTDSLMREIVSLVS